MSNTALYCCIIQYCIYAYLLHTTEIKPLLLFHVQVSILPLFILYFILFFAISLYPLLCTVSCIPVSAVQKVVHRCFLVLYQICKFLCTINVYIYPSYASGPVYVAFISASSLLLIRLCSWMVFGSTNVIINYPLCQSHQVLQQNQAKVSMWKYECLFISLRCHKFLLLQMFVTRSIFTVIYL